MEFGQDSNYSLLLDMVRKMNPISRVQLAEEFGLSKVTVSTIINELIDEGLIIEVGEGTGCEKEDASQFFWHSMPLINTRSVWT